MKLEIIFIIISSIISIYLWVGKKSNFVKELSYGFTSVIFSFIAAINIIFLLNKANKDSFDETLYSIIITSLFLLMLLYIIIKNQIKKQKRDSN
ncbi:hypothetical protein CMT94_13205 [Elizabethkingia anophelis]|nr:hypothetical protein [Elizabethkingia anophelis]MDV3852013.1 hypothetical protein [Elizabethkingia anophelis]